MPLTATVFAISQFVRSRIAGLGSRILLATGSVLVALMDGVPNEHAGAASELLQMDQQIGGALDIAAITSIYALTATPGDFASGTAAAFGGGQ